MKQAYIVFFILTMGIFSCGERSPKNRINSDIVTSFNVYTDQEFNSKILSIVSDYLDSVNRGAKDSLKACKLFIEQKNLDANYKISAVIHFSDVLGDMPQGYLSFRDKTILIYTGLEKLFKKPEAIPHSLANELEGKILNNLLSDLKTIDPEFRPKLYSYPTWEIELKNDSLFVNKTAEPVRRIKTIIYYLPDSIKNK